MRLKNTTDEKLIDIVKSSFTYTEIMKKLGFEKMLGGNYRSLILRIKKANIDTSHLLGKAHLKGKNHFSKNRINTSDILIKDSYYTNTHEIKKRLIKEKLMDYKCNKCGIENWMNDKITLHLDHINGDHSDHRLENLRLLCPNCHSQTPTYCGRNIKPKSKPKTINECLLCNENISAKSSKCRKCQISSIVRKTKIEWPDHKTLSSMVEETSFSEVGRKLGVSDNAVRKRLKTHSS